MSDFDLPDGWDRRTGRPVARSQTTVVSSTDPPEANASPSQKP